MTPQTLGPTILLTTNGGATWNAQSSGVVGERLKAVAFADADHGWAAGDDGTILCYRRDSAPTVRISDAGDSWHASPVDLTVTATVDPALTLASVQYSTNGGSTWSDVPGSGEVRTLPISAQGTTNVEVQVTDSVSETASDSATVNIDSTTPTITVSGCDSAWHASPVTLTFTPNVGPSGVASVRYQIGSGAWTTVTKSGGPYQAAISTEGANTVSYRVTNNAGTTSAVGVCAAKIDTIGPTTLAKAASGREGKAIALRYRVTDNLSPTATKVTLTIRNSHGRLVKRVALGTRTIFTWYAIRLTPKAKGSYRYAVAAKDLAGNAQTKVGSARITVR